MFLTPPEDELQCSVCLGVFNDPVQVCSEGHTYYRVCMTLSKAVKNACPVCRAPISREEPVRILKNMIEKLRVRCHHAACNGGSNCGGSGSGSGSGSGTTDSSSSSSGSGSGAATVDVEAGHQDKRRKQNHGAALSAVPAASCEWTGQLKDYEAHVAACPFVEVSCPFSGAGCAFRAARGDMGAHSSDMGAHFLMLMTTVAVVNAKITAVEAASAADKGRIAALEADRSSLQRYVSILQASGEEAAPGDVEFPCVVDAHAEQLREHGRQ
ncbi:hypothetical protein B484DRAFT_484208, partial [Ochromonadaceae sp. CCMP2298]